LNEYPPLVEVGWVAEPPKIFTAEQMVHEYNRYEYCLAIGRKYHRSGMYCDKADSWVTPIATDIKEEHQPHSGNIWGTTEVHNEEGIYSFEDADKYEKELREKLENERYTKVEFTLHNNLKPNKNDNIYNLGQDPSIDFNFSKITYKNQTIRTKDFEELCKRMLKNWEMLKKRLREW